MILDNNSPQQLPTLDISFIMLYITEQHEVSGACSTYGGEVYTGIWWGNHREGDHSEDPGVDGRMIMRWIFRKWDVVVWTGSSWLRIGISGGHLRML